MERRRLADERRVSAVLFWRDGPAEAGPYMRFAQTN